MHILRDRSRRVGLGLALCLALEQLQTSFDMDVGRIKVRRSAIRIQGVGGLIVARLVEGAQIIPHFRNVGVESDGARVSVERIAVLIDLVVENTDRAPEGWVASIAIDGLLVGFVRFGVLLLRHVAATEEVPALRVTVVCGEVSVGDSRS
jgi:hypothetical protein